MGTRRDLVLATTKTGEAMSHVIAELTFVERPFFYSGLGRFSMRMCLG